MSPWQMFTDQADRHVEASMQALALTVRAGDVKRTELVDKIRTVVEAIAEKHGEVYDTEPQYAIQDFVNELCDEQGWTHVSRWDW